MIFGKNPIKESTREGKWKRIIHEGCNVKDNPRGALKTIYYLTGSTHKQIRINNYKICDVCQKMVKLLQEEL